MNRGQLLTGAAALALSGCDQVHAVGASIRNGCLRYVGLPPARGVTIVYRTFESRLVAAPHRVTYGIAYPANADPRTIGQVGCGSGALSIIPGRAQQCRRRIR